MVCNKCGIEVADNALFCPGCGNKIEKTIEDKAEAVVETVEVVEEKKEEVKEEIKEEPVPVVPVAEVPSQAPAPVSVAPVVAPVAEVVTDTSVVASSLASAAVAPVETPVAPVVAPSEPETKKEAKPSRKAIKNKKDFEKKAKLQAVIDSLPAEYKPVSTSTYFWLAILAALPVIGFIMTIVFSVVGRNKNRKNFMKAIFVWYIIGIILALIAALVLTFVFPDSMSEIFYSASDILINLGL